ncbi:unnamed protein product [Victoria cruziana]
MALRKLLMMAALSNTTSILPYLATGVVLIIKYLQWQNGHRPHRGYHSGYRTHPRKRFGEAPLQDRPSIPMCRLQEKCRPSHPSLYRMQVDGENESTVGRPLEQKNEEGIDGPSDCLIRSSAFFGCRNFVKLTSRNPAIRHVSLLLYIDLIYNRSSDEFFCPSFSPSSTSLCFGFP